jgi:hypothetical protein
VSLLRCVERPSRHYLQLEWNSIADHQAFTKTQDFKTFRDIAGPFFSERPAMEHFQPVGPRPIDERLKAASMDPSGISRRVFDMQALFEGANP